MTIRVWDVPSDPPPGHELKDPVAILSGSSKKVIATEWNPVADFVLASGCFDGTVALWNVDSASLVSSVSLGDSVLSVKWSNSGDKLASTSKDKSLSIIDPREKNVVSSVTCHEGSKASKCCWVDGFAGAPGHVLTTGFSKSNVRELHLWDIKNFTKPETETFATSSFMAANVVDQKRAEVGRMIKNENGKSLLPVSFIVPRKNQDVFQADLYPPTPGTDAALTAAEWFSGKNGEVKRIPHQPAGGVTRLESTKSVSEQAPSVLQKSVEKAHDESRRLEEVLKTKEETIKRLEGRIKELEPLETKVKQQETQLKVLEASYIFPTMDFQASLTCTTKARNVAALFADTVEQAAVASRQQDASTNSAELEQKLRQLEAENASLQAQLEDSANKVVQALKEAKSKDTEMQSLRSKLKATENQLAEVTRSHEELSSSMAKAEGTLHRAATLSGLDEGVRQEFNEVGTAEGGEVEGRGVAGPALQAEISEDQSERSPRQTLKVVELCVNAPCDFADEGIPARHFGRDADRPQQGLTSGRMRLLLPWRLLSWLAATPSDSHCERCCRWPASAQRTCGGSPATRPLYATLISRLTSVIT
ncbi:hypothetical protein Emag_000356 [Eimeria magna]